MRESRGDDEVADTRAVRTLLDVVLTACRKYIATTMCWMEMSFDYKRIKISKEQRMKK